LACKARWLRDTARNAGTILSDHEFILHGNHAVNTRRKPSGGGQMGGFLFWIVLIGLPALLVVGFAYAHYLKRTGGTTRHEDGA